MLYADVEGERRRAAPRLEGYCPGCGRPLVPKCGTVNAWHWAHLAASDCDHWAEPTGPWHLSWQNAVDPLRVETPRGEHRADILGNDGVVIELQHALISSDEIAAREQFYGDMIWLFDATHRFRSVQSGEWIFFSVGRTRHLSFCRKPVFLDFGDWVVEVSSFTGVFPECHGIGITRDRSWFIERHLSDVLTGQVALVRSDDVCPDPWAERCPHRPVGFPSKWHVDGEPRILPATTTMIPLGDPRGRRAIADEIIDHFGDIANGWTKASLQDMRQLLRGTPVILEGLLRVMPALPDDVCWTMRGTVPPLSVHMLMRESDDHARAGRIPLLKETTKRAIVERTLVARTMSMARSR